MRRPARLAAVVAAVAAATLLMPSGASAGGAPVALVTAETENEVLAVSLPGGRILRRVRVHDPQTIVAGVTGPAVVVSPSGAVTLLAWRSLRPVAVLRGFRSPQMTAITPDGKWAYVTDAATGYLSVIELQTGMVVNRLYVGAGAHHLAVSPDQRRAWVALGESATTILVLDTSQPERPRVIGRFHPAVPAHDLAFAPDGRTVWVGSAAAPSVFVLNAHTARTVARVPAGPAPQHVVFVPYGPPHAFVTSGYGSRIEEVDVRTRRILRSARVPYGSFNLAAAGDVVAASSLLDGEVSEFNGATLARWLTRRVAPSARDIAISVW
jgi:DNA-binding beta-propeller fold protein YncE